MRAEAHTSATRGTGLMAMAKQVRRRDARMPRSMRAEAHTSATPDRWRNFIQYAGTLNEGRGSHLGNTPAPIQLLRSRLLDAQ